MTRPWLDQDDTPLMGDDPHDLHGSRGTLPPSCLSPEPKAPAFGSWIARKLGRINWFIVALCLATLAWCVYRSVTIHNEQVRAAASQVQP